MFTLLFLLSAAEIQAKIQEISGSTMGTTYSVKYKSSKIKPDFIQKKAERLLLEINQEMSTYIVDSGISRFNQYKKTQSFKINLHFKAVVQAAIQIAKESNGYFDPTVGPAVNLWGFGPQGAQKKPTEKQISTTLKKIGYKKLILSTEKSTLSKSHTDLYLDLSAIAKGYGVDILAALLDKLKVENYLVEIGGELKASGKK